MTVLTFNGTVNFPASSFTVTVTPSDPVVGEPYQVIYSGISDFKQRWLQTALQTDGDAFSYMTGEDYGIAPGHCFSHAHSTGGTKSHRLSSWTTGGEIKTQDLTVNVGALDSVSWDHIYYVDLNGNSGGMPAESGVIEHILSWADFSALKNSFSSADKVLLYFRSGTTQSMLPTTSGDVPQWDAGRVHCTTFGGSSLAVIDFTSIASYVNISGFFRADSSNSRWTFHNIRFVGDYDIVQGYYSKAKVRLFSFDSSVSNVNVGFYRCEFEGLDMPVSGGNVDSNHVVTMLDCRGIDNQNYGLGAVFYTKSVAVRGCVSDQDILTCRGDSKTGAPADFADHSAFRCTFYGDVGITQSDAQVRGGWSTGFGTDDKAIQPAFRVYSNAVKSGTTGHVSILWNKAIGRLLAQVGNANESSKSLVQQGPCNFVIAGNYWQASQGQGELLVQAVATGGVALYSNVGYIPNLPNAGSSGNVHILTKGSWETEPIEVWDNPDFIYGNTLVCDWNNQPQGTATKEIFAVFINSTHDSNGTPSQNNYTVADNLLSGDNMNLAESDATVASSAFSRGEELRPITASAAETTTANGPPISFDRVRNAGTTNVGAHHSAAANTSAASPTFTGTPTIALLSGRTGILGVTGGLTATGSEYPSVVYNWYLNGTALTGDALIAPYQDIADFSASDELAVEFLVSDLSGNVVASNRSAVYTVP